MSFPDIKRNFIQNGAVVFDYLKEAIYISCVFTGFLNRTVDKSPVVAVALVVTATAGPTAGQAEALRSIIRIPNQSLAYLFIRLPPSKLRCAGFEKERKTTLRG